MLSVAISNFPFRYLLNENDLRDTFQRWGPIVSTYINREGSREVGVVIFSDSFDAADAQRQLNGQMCNLEGTAGTLAVIHGDPRVLSPPLQPPPMQQGPPMGMPGTMPGMGMGPPMPMQQGGPPPSAPGPLPPAPQQGPPPQLGGGPLPAQPAPQQPQQPQPQQPQQPPQQSQPQPPQYCCKIFVQAQDLHPEFPIAVKVMGEGRANFEHIAAHNQCTVTLRGIGSGTLEPNGSESAEGLYVFLTSESAEHGNTAKDMVLDLLKSVYDDHKTWCQQNNLNHPDWVQAKVVVNPGPDGAPAIMDAPAPQQGAPITPQTPQTPAPGNPPALVNNGCAAPMNQQPPLQPAAQAGPGGYGPSSGGGFKGPGPY